MLRLTKAISQLRQEKAQLALDVEREEEVGGSNVDVRGWIDFDFDCSLTYLSVPAFTTNNRC